MRMRKEEALSTKGRKRMTQRLGVCCCVFSFPCKSCHLWLSKSFWYEREPLQGDKTGWEPSPNVQAICKLFVSVKNSKLTALNPAVFSSWCSSCRLSCSLVTNFDLERDLEARRVIPVACNPPEGASIVFIFYIYVFMYFQVLPELVFFLLFHWSLMQSSLSSLQTKKEHLYTWRIELAKTEKYWDGWFRGLSNLFLSCPTPKLLLLAGTCPVQS